MKSKSIFLIGISLAFGLVAAIGITQVMGRKTTETVETVEKVPVLVAIEDLDINTELKPEMFKVEEWPADLVPEGVVTTIEEIENKVVTSRIGKKGPIYASNLVNKSDLREKQIPAGFKVIGVKLGADNHLSGLLEPGDLVDVIGVFKVRGPRGNGSTSRTFLRKIRVFSIASRMTKDIERDPSAKGDVIVGLLVTEKQSEQIVLVQKVADLQLAMRSTEETREVNMGDGTGFGNFDEESPSSASNRLSDMFKRLTGESSEPKTKPASFVTTVYTAEGPTQYHFNASGGGSSVPMRIQGFGDEEEEEQSDDKKTSDFDEDSTDDDSKPFTDDLDSEPED